METSELCQIEGCEQERSRHPVTGKYNHSYCMPHVVERTRAARAAWKYEVERPDGEIKTYVTGSASVRAALAAGWPVRRIYAENGITPVPERNDTPPLSAVDAANRAIKARVKERLRVAYAVLDAQFDENEEQEGVVFQVYAWSHREQYEEVKVGHCDIAADRIGLTRTDDRHFDPIVHFVLSVGTKERAKAVEDEFKREFASVRLPHVGTGNPSEFYRVSPALARAAVERLILFICEEAA